MKAGRIFAVSAAALTLASGCSFFGDKTQEVTILTEPKDAEVLVNNKQCGNPVSVVVPCDQPLAVVVRKPGYQTCTKTVTPVLSKLGLLDVVGTVLFLVPGIGLFSDAAQELPETNLYIVLDKETEESALR